jgi:hypothetical protein
VKSAGDARVALQLEAGADAGDVLERAVAKLVEAGIGVREATPTRATLEEVFAELTKDDAAVRAEQEGPDE